MGKSYERPPLPERFFSKIETTETCHLWHGAINKDGYGHISKDGRLIGAHRIAWELAHGAIPEGMHVLHKCDTRNCVNPDHLFLGTHKENMADRQRKGRTASGNRSGARTKPEIRIVEGRKLRKITFEDAQEIRKRMQQGGVFKEHLAKEYGISVAATRSILDFKTYKTP